LHRKGLQVVAGSGKRVPAQIKRLGRAQWP
jgi:hypothetical protein